MRGKAYIIGAGGVGSWLAHTLAKLVGPEHLVLVDGDKLERKNIDRQLFDVSNIGDNKAEALANKLKCAAEPIWFNAGYFDLSPDDWLFGCVDNHPSRKTILRECDRTNCQAIIACNETTSAEAFHYNSVWSGTRLDPRVYYPSIESVTTDDPRAAAIGCTGEAQEANRQLVSANFMAAALAQHLFVLWELEILKIDADVRNLLPFHLRANLARLETFRVCEFMEKKDNEHSSIRVS